MGWKDDATPGGGHVTRPMVFPPEPSAECSAESYPILSLSSCLMTTLLPALAFLACPSPSHV